MKAARKFFVGGNWKSNGSVSSIKDLIGKVLNPHPFDFQSVDVVISPTFVHLPLVQSLLKPGFQVSAQNASLTGPGAYTGEISPESLKDLGINWVILGHSERRSFYGESDEVVSGKIKRSLKSELNVVACVGENLKERESQITNDVITRQLSAMKGNIIDWNRVVIAYEPVWAIGTGVSATPEQAQEVHDFIRNWIRREVGVGESEKTRIIYGGSVTEGNCGVLVGMKDIDGFLVGGASLKKSFVDIVESGKRKL